MDGSVRDVMTPDPVTVDITASAVDAARLMRERDVGAVIVLEDGAVGGIVTDRDITVRAVAEGTDPSAVRLGEICTPSPTTISPDTTVDEALEIMQAEAIRRLPVVENDQPVGIVSLGDLSHDEEAGEALAEISDAPANN